MKFALLLLITVVLLASATSFNVAVSGGMLWATGPWGNNFDSGMSCELNAVWNILPSLSTGVIVSGIAYNGIDDGRASLNMFNYGILAGYYLRPWGATFNPGIECSFGMNRSSLTNGTGSDPITWDPCWKAGLVWDFSIGGGLRGAIGCDYIQVLAEKQTSESFGMRIRISKEISL